MKRVKLLGVLLIGLMLPMFVDAAENPIAKIGDQTYTTFQDAVDAAGSTQTTIEVLRSGQEVPGFVVAEGQNIVVDFKNFTIEFGEPLVGSTGTKSQNIQLLKNSTVTLKNGVLKAAPAARMLIQNYSNLTLEDITIDATTMTNTTNVWAVSLNNGTVNITGETNIYSNGYAFDVYYFPVFSSGKVAYPNGTQVTVNTTGTIKGDIDVNGDTVENATSTLHIENINHEGNILVKSQLEDKLTIEGGTFTSDVTAYLVDGASSTMYENNKIVVGYKVNITQYDANAGSITVENKIVPVGEKVTISIQSNNQYNMKSLVVTDASGKNITVENYTFTMPNSDVTITGTFEELAYIQEVEAPIVDITKQVEEILVGVADETVKEVILNSLNSSDLDVADKNVVVNVNIQNFDKTLLESELITDMEEALTKKYTNGKIAEYFEITLNVMDSDTNNFLGELTKLNSNISVSIVLPKELQEVEDGYLRKYYVVRNHNGEISILDTVVSNDGNSLTFETDQFSTYALAYEDVSSSIEVPSTYDGIATYIFVGMISLIGFVGIGIYFKKQLRNS